MHEMKIDKSRNYCYLSKNEDSFYAVIAIIPDEALQDLSAKALGKLVDAIWKSWQDTKHIHEADIIAEGAVWDESKQRMIELCQS